MEKLMSLAMLCRSRLIFPLLFILMLLWGCRETPLHRTLLQADSVMESDPDSAYALLAPLQVDSTAPEGDRALHALLLTQAMHKTHRLVEDSVIAVQCADSMIRLALPYFDKNDDVVNMMKAFYYNGVLLSMTPDSCSVALRPLSRSLELAFKIKDPFWIAKNYDLMGDVFFQGNAFRDMVEAQKSAHEYYIRSGREDFIRWSWLSLAQAQLSAGEYLDAEVSLKPLLISDTTEPYLRSQAAETMAKIMFYKGRFDKSVSLISSMDSIRENHPEMPFFLISSYIESDSLDHARKLYGQFRDILGDDEVSLIEGRLAEKSGDPAGMVKLGRVYSNLARDYKNTVCMDFNTLQQTISRDKDERNLAESMGQRKLWIGIVGLVMISCLVCLAIFYRRKRMAEMDYLSEIEGYKEIISKAETLERTHTAAIETLQSEIRHWKEKHTDAETRFRKKMGEIKKDLKATTLALLTKERDDLSKLISVYYTYGGDESRAEAKIIELIRVKVNRYKSTRKKVRIFEEKVNYENDGIISRLRKDFPDMKPEYIEHVIYHLMGFDSKAIAFLTNTGDLRKVVNRIYYIRGKLRKLPEEQRIFYARILWDSDDAGTQKAL